MVCTMREYPLLCVAASCLVPCYRTRCASRPPLREASPPLVHVAPPCCCSLLYPVWTIPPPAYQFARGLNMPARTVVFTATHKWDGEENRCISSGEYIQVGASHRASTSR